MAGYINLKAFPVVIKEHDDNTNVVARVKKTYSLREKKGI